MSKKEFIFDEQAILGEAGYTKYLELEEKLGLIYSGHGDESELPSILNQFIQYITDYPNLISAYEHLINLLHDSGKEMEALAIEYKAIEHTLALVLDVKGNFPKSLEWGFIENRPIIRFIIQHAENCWTNGEQDEAKKMYQGLLSSNPKDNIGARYGYLAMLKGMSIEEYQNKASDEEGYMKQDYMDWFENESKGLKEFDEIWKAVAEKEE